MDSNRNAAPEAAPARDLNPVAQGGELRDGALRAALALGLALALAGMVGATWAYGADPAGRGAVRSSYSTGEMERAETDQERQLRQIREQEVTQLRIALGRRLPENRRADLYFRLAEIYLELYRAEFLREGKVHETRIARGVPDKFIDRGHSKPFLALGIKACQEILRLRIPFARLDQVHYFLGFYHAELENRAESERHWAELVRRHPDSPFAIEAYRELGAAAFARNEYPKAEQYLEAAVKAGSRPGAPGLADGLPRTLHRLAWTYYRGRKYGQAIETMKLAVEKTSGDQEKFLSVREEALRDMAVFMTEAGRVDEAIEYFRRVLGDRDFYPRALERLGRQYERNVEPQKAAQVYEALVRTAGSSEAAFRTEVKLVDLDLRRGRFAEARSRIEKTELREKGEADTVTAAQNLKAMTRRTATENHERFRKEGDRKALAVAEAFYSLYLAKFLDRGRARTREVPEIRMYLADVSRELGKAAEASALYKQVVESKDERYAKEAAALWTASLSDAIRKAAAGRPKDASVDRPSELEEEFVDAADQLVRNLQGTNEAREAQLRSAQVLAGYPRTQGDAIKRARRLIAESPESAQALTAARLWLQVLGDTKADADDVSDAVKELRANAGLMKADAGRGEGKLAAQMEDFERRAKVGVIAALEKDRDFAGAAKGYEEFAVQAPSRELAEKAWGNAVGAYAKAGDFTGALRAAEAWLAKFPPKAGAASPAIEQIRGLATAALIRGGYEESARLFERLARATRDPEALETAARIHEGNGNPAAARAAWNAHLAEFPKAPGRWGVLLALARSHDQDGQDAEAARSYKAAQAGPAEVSAEALARLGDLYRRAQDEENALATWRRAAATRKAASPFVGYARFRLAETREAQVRFEPMALPEASLKKALNARLEFVESLSRAYNEVVEVGGPWGVAALDRLASWVYDFAAEVDRIAPPANVDEKTVAGFRRSLKSVSDPLRARAVQTWESAYRRAAADEILSPALPGIVDQLADAGSRAVSRAQGPRGRFRLGGVPADGGADGRVTALATVRQRLTDNARDAQGWVDYGNLLWGEGKPGLAAIAYDRALGLNAKLASASNNRAVVTLTGSAQEDWVKAAQAHALLRVSLRQDEFFLPAKINLAQLLNYYRLFAKARPLWGQVAAKAPSADVQLGLGVALAGLGDGKAAWAAFEASAAGQGDSAYRKFPLSFHMAAAKIAQSGRDGADDCVTKLENTDAGGLAGFEKSAFENLKRTCEQWKRSEM